MASQDLERTNAVRVGTAGWSLPAAHRDRFPSAGSHLERYAALLDAAEINSSFYRGHRRATYARWASSVPDAFRFAVKVPKAVTHERRLLDCAALIDTFADEIGGLGTKLGPLLCQLPPSLAFEAEAANGFFPTLRDRIQASVACEPRHASWFTAEADALLAQHRVARVAVDPAPVPAGAEPGGWRGLIYRRLHGSPTIYQSNYDEEALASLRLRLGADVRDLAHVWCIFDNTTFGHALGNALSIRGCAQAKPPGVTF